MCQGSATTLEAGSVAASNIPIGPFANLKAPLRGHRFLTRDDIVIPVRRLIMTNFSHGEADGIRRFPHRWQRTIDNLQDYFEGL